MAARKPGTAPVEAITHGDKLVQVSGGAKRHHSPGSVKEKAATARHLWVPAVNRHGGWGLWSFVEVGDPASARPLIADAVAALAVSGKVPV